MAEENISEEFRPKNTDETRNYLIEEINRYELISKRHKKDLYNSKLYWIFLVLACTITRCISVFTFAFMIGIPMVTTSSTIGLKTCAITAVIKIFNN